MKNENMIKYENQLLTRTIRDMSVNDLLLLAKGVLNSNSKNYTVEYRDNAFILDNGKEKIILTRDQLVDNIVYSIYSNMYDSCTAGVLIDRSAEIAVNIIYHLANGETFGIEIVDVSDSSVTISVLSMMECGSTGLKHTKRILITKDGVYKGKKVDEVLEKYRGEIKKSKEKYKISFHISNGFTKPIKIQTVAILKTPEDSYLDESLCSNREVSDMEEAINYLLNKVKELPDNVTELTLEIEDLCPYKSYKAITDISIAAVKCYPNILIKSEYNKRSENENI